MSTPMDILSSQADPRTIAELQESLRLAQQELALSKERIKDLTAQLAEARASRLISPAELEDIARLRSEHTQMHEQIAALALWLRHNRKTELERGDYKGKDIVDVVLGMIPKRWFQ